MLFLGQNKKGVIKMTTKDEAFKRFKTWLLKRDIPVGLAKNFMFMTEDDEYLNFKNIRTRNYIHVNKKPTIFDE